jgi:hypothetical protein
VMMRRDSLHESFDKDNTLGLVSVS